jgi:hypothetical protein
MIAASWLREQEPKCLMNLLCLLRGITIVSVTGQRVLCPAPRVPRRNAALLRPGGSTFCARWRGWRNARFFPWPRLH